MSATEAGPARTITVMIVDDDPIVRSALSSYITSAPDLTLVGTCADGAEAVAAVGRGSVDVVIMDIRMPVMDGITATREIRSRHPDVHVLLLTSFDEDDTMVTALRAGAGGFLLKNESPGAVVDAVRAVSRGNTVVTTERVSRLLDQGRRRPAPAAPGPGAADGVHLSQREMEILDLLCRAQSNGEIASGLHLSESTVKTHVSSIMAKLSVGSRLKAVIRAYELGLVSRD